MTDLSLSSAAAQCAGGALHLLRANIKNLLSESARLYRRRQFAIATHLAIVCSEECAKMLLLLSKDHLPPEVFAKRFNHKHKFQIRGAPWFFSGGLQIVYLLQIAKNESFLGGTDEDFQVVLDDLFRHCGWSDSRRIAEVILQNFSPSPETSVAIDASRDKRERHRTTSVYVDIGLDMEVIGQPNEISRDDARAYIEDCRVANSVIDFLLSAEPNVIAFIDSLPRKLRDEARAKGREMVAHVKSGKVNKLTDHSATV